MTRRIHPTIDLYSVLQKVDKPGRYVGGEWGSIRKSDDEVDLRIAVTFPDLYEIGMSNTAIKILYGMLNTIDGVACERVFSPAPDFEGELRARSIPLYTLETGVALHEVDIIAVSFGFELLATNLLTLLDVGGIPIRRKDRGQSDPIILVGGPGSTNPAPIGPFVDGVFIGEAESSLPDLIRRIVALKREGASRADIVEVIHSEPTVWFEGRTTPVRRGIWNDFGDNASFRRENGVPHSFGAGYPVPSIPIVHDHGVVEIMRGCPQGCRFCHAGVYYRPYRMKSIAHIVDEVRWIVEELGYREISLSSLSTGDYSELLQLIHVLNDQFGSRGVTFSLPSLRVNSVTLPIFEAISRGKKSGLTFAVESAAEEDQRVVNKIVPLERVIAIAKEARNRGWQHAKLYFMIGLPLHDGTNEGERIAEYVRRLRREVPMEYVVNVGTFVPKPHTPFQWARQITPTEADRRVDTIRNGLPKGTKLRLHDPRISWLEGIVTRGSAAIADVIEAAFRRGARLDAWGEYTRFDIWQELAESSEFGEAIQQAMGPFQEEKELPWDSVSLGVTKGYLKREKQRAEEGELTERCSPDCDEGRCGVCNRETNVRETTNTKKGSESHPESRSEEQNRKRARNGNDSTPESAGSGVRQSREFQLILNYSKEGSAAFLPHLALVRTFERVWHRSGVPFALSQGYHPKPKMSFSQPMPLGADSDDEIVIVNVLNTIQLDKLYHKLAVALPDGFALHGMLLLHHESGTPRIPSPMQAYRGARYQILFDESRGDESRVKNDFFVGETLKIFVEHGAVFRTDPLGSDDQVFDLHATAPGVGRILKVVPRREELRIRRLQTFGGDIDQKTDDDDRLETSLWEYYRSRSDCFASFQS